MSDQLLIRGGKQLCGSVPISGAKNAALKQIAACLLTKDVVTLSNVPHLDDITLMLQLMLELGCKVTLHDHGKISIDPSAVNQVKVPYELVRAMRASIVVLGPLLARFGEAKVALPGGCAIGPRPIDIHLDGLAAMGAKLENSEGFVHASSEGRLKGAHFHMKKVSVTATENLMMAATLADGETLLENAACEPEVEDLANMLVAMGANIQGIGTDTLKIIGVESLQGIQHDVMADRIEAGTYLAAAAITGGKVTLENIKPYCIHNVLVKFKESGAKIKMRPNSVTLDMQGRMLRAVNIETAAYPGFPTDMQAQFMALNAVAAGVGMIKETVFENRFMHVAELLRLGANIRVDGDVATSAGVQYLVGAPVTASDLRAAASLVCAGLAAKGETRIDGLQHMDRGYSFLEEKLRRLGADIQRV